MCVRPFLVLAAVVSVACSPSSVDPPTGCETGRADCGGSCVDVLSDPLHCGGCDGACDAGSVCVDGACTTWDCRSAPCPGLAYCDLGSGTCIPGCAFDDQCAASEACSVASHTCECLVDTHRCGGACVSSTSTSSCGSACAPCPGDPNGAPTCDGVRCGLSCNVGTLLCEGACAPCPSGGGSSFVCDGARCVADACGAGFRLCGSGCAACPSSLETACDGDRCVAASCPEGEVLCDEGCCPWAFDTVGGSGVRCGGAGGGGDGCGSGGRR